MNSSGTISLGGSTTGESIAIEIGQSPTAQISLNDPSVRAVAEKTTPESQISMPVDFWGKTAPPSPPSPPADILILGTVAVSNPPGDIFDDIEIDCLLSTPAGNFLIGIYCRPYNFYIARISSTTAAIEFQNSIVAPTGSTVWTSKRTYTGSMSTVDIDGNIGVFTSADGNTDNIFYATFYLMSGSTGAILRRMQFNYAIQFPGRISADKISPAIFYLLGQNSVVKINASGGSVYWSSRLGTTLYTCGTATTSDGSVYGVWYESHSTTWIVLAKLDPNTGGLIWQKRFLGSAVCNYFYDNGVGQVDITSDNNDNLIIMLGYVYSPAFPNPIYRGVLKFNSSGTLQWQIEFNGPDALAFSRMFVDSNNDIYFAGQSTPPDDPYTTAAYVCKLSGFDGSMLWQKTFAAQSPYKDPIYSYEAIWAADVSISTDGYLLVLLGTTYLHSYDVSWCNIVLTLKMDPFGNIGSGTYTLDSSMGTAAGYKIVTSTPTYTVIPGTLTETTSSFTQTNLSTTLRSYTADTIAEYNTSSTQLI